VGRIAEQQDLADAPGGSVELEQIVVIGRQGVQPAQYLAGLPGETGEVPTQGADVVGSRIPGRGVGHQVVVDGALPH
jgi:hypothetical protein